MMRKRKTAPEPARPFCPPRTGRPAAGCSLLLVIILASGCLWQAQAEAAPPAPPEAQFMPPQDEPDSTVPLPRLPDIKQATTAWLQANITIPDSYEPLDWSEPVLQPPGGPFVWAIRHLYRYEHGEYGILEADDIFYMDHNGEIAGRTTTTWKWRHNWWGRGWEKYGP